MGMSDDGREAASSRTSPPASAEPAPALAEGQRRPDFFIVGQPKSGTTALYEMLRGHPQIHMPDRKEPWYLARELLERTPPRPGGTPQTVEEYLAWFEGARPDQRVGEASALYLWSRTAAARIAQLQPEARIVAILREPTSLLRSLHMQFVRSYVETENDFPRAISLEGARREGRHVPRRSYWPQALLYSEHVRYVEQLRRFYAVFPHEQVLVLIYDDFVRDNEETVRTVLRFLEVDDTAPIEVTEANPTMGVRSQRLHELVHAVSVGHGPISQAVKAAVKAAAPTRLRRSALYATQRSVVYVEPPAPDERFMLELRRRFKGEVVALSECLGRDLVALWGYDSVE